MLSKPSAQESLQRAATSEGCGNCFKEHSYTVTVLSKESEEGDHMLIGQKERLEQAEQNRNEFRAVLWPVLARRSD